MCQRWVGEGWAEPSHCAFQATRPNKGVQAAAVCIQVQSAVCKSGAQFADINCYLTLVAAGLELGEGRPGSVGFPRVGGRGWGLSLPGPTTEGTDMVFFTEQ